MEVLRATVGDAEAGARLDSFLASALPRFSRRQVRKLITLGGVRRGTRRVSRVSRAVEAGEEYVVYLDGREIRPLFHVRPGTILYIDRDLIAVDKQPGIESQPTPARYRGTVYAAVRDYLKSEGLPATIGMHSRLDRMVSGVMVLSISRRAHGAMTEAFSSRRVKKYYLAWTRAPGGTRCGVIQHSLRRRGGRQTVDASGMEAITRYRVLAVSPHFSYKRRASA